MNTSYWTRLQGTPIVNTWLGLAYERVCMAHVSQIKRALGIGSVVTEAYSWRSKDSEHPAQIDLLIDRTYNQKLPTRGIQLRPRICNDGG